MSSDAGRGVPSERGTDTSGQMPVGATAARPADPNAWRAGEQPDPNRWKALSVCLVAGFMTLLDVSIVNVAIPSIRTGLHASDSALQWIVAGYALAFGLALVPTGRLGDARSRRTVFAVGLVCFTAASGFAGAASSDTWLTIARVVQGLGAGAVSPQVAGFIQSLFRGQERARAFGLFGATVGVSTAVGPLVGGALIVAGGQAEGWRWVFFVNLPIGVVALVLARRYLPRGSPSGDAERLDPIGVALLTAGLLLLLWPLVHGNEQSLSGRVWWLEGVAAAVIAGFLAWELWLGRRGGQPMVDVSLFRLRSYALGTTLAAIYFAGFTPLFLILTLYLQVGMNYSALLAGATGVPFALGSAIGAGAGGRVVLRFGRDFVAGGLVLVIVGLVAIGVVVGHATHDVGWLLAGPLLVAGLGSGAVIAPNQTLTLSEVPHVGGGSGAGVLQTAQRIGTAVGIAVVTAFFFSQVAQAGVGHHGRASLADYAHALQLGIVVNVVFVVLALATGVVDVIAGRRGGPTVAGRRQDRTVAGRRQDRTVAGRRGSSTPHA